MEIPLIMNRFPVDTPRDGPGRSMIPMLLRWGVFVMAGILLWGCAPRRVQLPYAPEYSIPPEVEIREQPRRERAQVKARAPDLRWQRRVITEKELFQLIDRDPELSLTASWEILARLNIRARYYISQDIRQGRPLKVPNDFSAYKHWTPLPRFIPEAANARKFILVVKDIPFLGWYERGRLKGDSQICIGRKGEWTEAGLYKVRTKDIDHFSRSYPNAFGQPAPMPYALRIYDHVWIHLGDITSGYCSHGCINLPLGTAERVYAWADFETFVLVVESLGDMEDVLEAQTRRQTFGAEKLPDPRVREPGDR